MLMGIIFIIAGLLIALYPPLLSIIVAFFLIFVGISLTIIGYHYKKAAKSFDNPYIDFFFRF